MSINQSINKWQQIVSNFKNLIVDKSSKNTTVSNSYKCQLDLVFLSTLHACVPATTVNSRVVPMILLVMRAISPERFAYQHKRESPTAAPCCWAHIPVPCLLRQNDKLKCLVEIGGLTNLPFDKNHVFFQFLQIKQDCHPKKPGVQGHGLEVVKCQQGSLGYGAQIHPSRPIQAHPGHNPSDPRIFWSISALLQRTNHAMLRSPARYTCPNQDVNSPGSNHRILEILLFFGCP